jgi:hypothetical protein
LRLNSSFQRYLSWETPPRRGISEETILFLPRDGSYRKIYDMQKFELALLKIRPKITRTGILLFSGAEIFEYGYLAV